ncbi:MAG: hypothetical protein LBN39_13155 [Planctomycetaceae bacterium]|jgi:hypothetical protein|nr:hypothetical protein [Planctomycetaceae bacterium]
MYRILLAVVFAAVCSAVFAEDAFAPCGNVLFKIGRPDARTEEFRRWIRWEDHINSKEPVIRFRAGQDRDRDWTAMHISTRDMKNAGHSFRAEIDFDTDKTYDTPLYLIIGSSFYHATEPSLIHIEVNGHKTTPVRAPSGGIEPVHFNFDGANQTGFFRPTVIEIPKGAVVQGGNKLTILLNDGSWIFYDYLVLCDKPNPPEQLPPKDLKAEFRTGGMKDANEILFVVRKPGTDEHWYANFGYYAASKDQTPFPLGAGTKLQILNADTGQVRTLFEDDGGTIRDPQLNYDGDKIIFSYCPKGKRHFNLYELKLENGEWRMGKQLTSGDWDDIEPTYTPDGDIIFCSSRAKRWVQCWLTQVATLYRCGPNGENITEISANVEQDNTPWMLPNGQVLYTRWEYVDRSQVHYHHLWTANPDGTRHAVFYGNLIPDTLMIDSKPVENSNKIVSIFSPGHGRTEHLGWLTLVDPTLGPDHPNGALRIGFHVDHHDPWAFSETEFMAAKKTQLQLIDVDGCEQTIYQLPDDLRAAGFWIHEPRPMKKRQREMILSGQTDKSKNTGHLALVNVYEGRQMRGVKPGTVKQLLVLETLPEPIHYSGGMDQISVGGTFTLERIVGTVPVEPDGSASMELPANRAFLFIAMDGENKPVKRMHSFTNVMPGETSVCIGCHEPRMEAPPAIRDTAVKILNRSPVKPKPVEGVPEVFDFVRDIQPILDKHCLSCHNDTKTDGGVNLSGDWGPQYSHSYITLSWRNSFGDNRNRPVSNFKPYEIGSSASKLMKLINEKHYEAELSDAEKKIVQYWLEAGANYAGTYAANGTGQIGWPYRNQMVHTDADWAEVKAMSGAAHRRCDSCHQKEGDKDRRVPHALTHNTQGPNRHLVFNFSKPERSSYLRAPLAKEAGGTQRCREIVFKDTDDPDYKILLAGIERGQRYILEESNRFSMQPFHANEAYTREMKRYGILPPDFDRLKTPLDPYQTDRLYWESLWYKR